MFEITDRTLFKTNISCKQTNSVVMKGFRGCCIKKWKMYWYKIFEILNAEYNSLKFLMKSGDEICREEKCKV